ncbi:MAG TPA: hypothetical protein V6C71_15375 [Coleofasciculaceae cyanobacterium]|jgi:hypothetical protein
MFNISLHIFNITMFGDRETEEQISATHLEFYKKMEVKNILKG